MSTYRFDGLPSNSSVAAAVTLAVCAWFWVAGAALIVAPPVQQAVAPTNVVYTAPAVSIAPEARLIIVVEGHRA